ncbi:MAG: transposase [Gammaproteobacteria bacterium]|nr:transposase [Gammaproteobacteria bacterium]
MRYRRARIAGATYFFTVNLADRQSSLLVEYIDALRETLRHVRREHPFGIDAMVILPEHLHAIWMLPTNDADFATRWMLIKAGFSRQMPPVERRSLSRTTKGERGIWQRRYWEHLIRDEQDFACHVAYIHFNPVKHGLVIRAVDWPYSSIHRYIRQGLVASDWASEATEETGFGE